MALPHLRHRFTHSHLLRLKTLKKDSTRLQSLEIKKLEAEIQSKLHLASSLKEQNETLQRKEKILQVGPEGEGRVGREGRVGGALSQNRCSVLFSGHGQQQRAHDQRG